VWLTRLNAIDTSNQLATMTENRRLAPMRLMDGKPPASADAADGRKTAG
jgi:hypothetical protein